jgi:hypothetical protein
MLVEPAFIRVDGCSDLLVKARRLSPEPAVVRIWAREREGRKTKLAEFAQFELRPGRGEECHRHIPRLNRPPFLLAVVVFQLIAPLTWERLLPEGERALSGSSVRLAFRGQAGGTAAAYGPAAVELDILYA